MDKFEKFNKPETNDDLQFLYDDEVEAINGYKKVRVKIEERTDIPEDIKKKLLEKIDYIVDDEVEHCEIITELIKLVNDTQK